MTTSLIVLILTAIALAFWSAGRAAAETAITHGRHACEAAGVQWLDQSVHLVAMRLRRGPDGRMGWERQFQFDYSTGGDDRHAGRLTLHGLRLTALIGPMPKAAPAAPEPITQSPVTPLWRQ